MEAGARVVGPTIIGSDVRIGSGSEVGQFAAVGDKASIHHSSVCRSILLDGATLEGIQIVNSLIGRKVEIRSPSTNPREISLNIGESSRVLL